MLWGASPLKKFQTEPWYSSLGGAVCKREPTGAGGWTTALSVSALTLSRQL